MKKKILLSTALFAVLAFGASSTFAAPPPPGGAPGGPGGHKASPNMHRAPVHNHVIHQPPRHHHSHVRHYSGYYSPYYCDCCSPLSFGFSTGRYYRPIPYGNFGAHFHISI